MLSKNKKATSLNRPLLPGPLIQLFGVASLVLIPWTIWLARLLPADYLNRRWDVAWSGFDISLLTTLALTAYFGFHKSGWIVVTAPIAGTLLVVDAWFDCLTAKQGSQYLLSLATAILFEIPLAALAFWVAYRSGKHFLKAR